LPGRIKDLDDMSMTSRIIGSNVNLAIIDPVVLEKLLNPLNRGTVVANRKASFCVHQNDERLVTTRLPRLGLKESHIELLVDERSRHDEENQDTQREFDEPASWTRATKKQNPYKEKKI
jgi:hypothetical protein